jgi:hypothetical protein
LPRKDSHLAIAVTSLERHCKLMCAIDQWTQSIQFPLSVTEETKPALRF